MDPPVSDVGMLRGAKGRTADIELSVIIAVRDPQRAAPIQQLYSDYKRQIEKTGRRHEIIFVIEGRHTRLFEELRRLKEQDGCIKILVFAKSYGDATALNAGYKHAAGAILLTLPAYHQIDPQAIPSLIDSLSEHDMVIVRRWPRVDRKLNRLQTRFFHYLLKKMLGITFHDLTCSVRIVKRGVIENVRMYGDQHRFFPLLVSRYGYKVKEIEIPQAEEDAFPRVLSVGGYSRRLLDLLSIFFLVKFTVKPLRFFGLTGLVIFGVGAVFTMYLVIQRLFMGVALADKPVLLLGVLLIVLGILLFAIGLIGELIIFTHAKDLNEHIIEKIV